MRGESRNSHRDERTLGSGHRANRGEELVGSRPVDNTEKGLASLGQLQ